MRVFLQHLAHVLAATPKGCSDHSLNRACTGICTDTRQVSPGNLFIALPGERFDGHDFVYTARERGAKSPS